MSKYSGQKSIDIKRNDRATLGFIFPFILILQSSIESIWTELWDENTYGQIVIFSSVDNRSKRRKDWYAFVMALNTRRQVIPLE